MVRADVEIGGTDQTFNLTKGRDVQRAWGQIPQDYLTTVLLAGLDGEKMSTSLGNCIWINDPSEVKFRLMMRIADHLVPIYLECATRIPMAEVSRIEEDLRLGNSDPVAIKKKLAYEIVRIYDGEDEAAAAQEYFEKVIQKMEVPETVLTVEVDSDRLTVKELLDLMMQRNLGKSKSALRRLIEQRGVYINGVPLDPDTQELTLADGKIDVRIGKRGIGIMQVIKRKN
jgi:tyrosyl-tRNA synthetase